jgi:hypothetical protein
MNRPRTATLSLTLISLCSCVGPDAELVSRPGVELRIDSHELGTIEHSGGGLSTFQDSPERARSGLQVEFGSEVAAAVVQVFREDWNYPGFEVYELSGVLVGARGTQFVGEFESNEISLVMPWGVDAAFAVGTVREGGLIDELGFGEFTGELGLGLSWNGLQLSLGASLSSIDGSGTFDSTQFGAGAASVRQLNLAGENLGLFLDVRYQPPGLPVHGSLRASGGDRTGSAFGIGVRF